MSHKRVLFQRIVSPDGKSVAQAHSVTSAPGESDSAIAQTLTVKISSGDRSSSSSSSSSVSSSR